MRKRSNARVVPALLSLLMCASACEALVEDGRNPPPPGNTGSGTGGTVSPPSNPGPAPTGSGGAVGTGGSTPAAPDAGPAGGTGGAPAAACPYPAAPDLVATRFEIGSVIPNLTFTHEDGKTFTFAELRCNKKNKLLYWAVGGDLCGPCIGTAKAIEVPAWQELGSQGLFILESFNGMGGLVSAEPFDGWRKWVPTWPKDDEHIAIVAEPKMKPYYAMGRITNGIPWVAVIELETMKVVNRSRPSVAGLRSLVMATPARP